jgi:peptide deformylase
MKDIKVEGTALLARALCHEIDHLDGHMYTEKVEGDLIDITPEGGEENFDA